MNELDGVVVNDVYRVIDLTGVLLNGILGGKLARTKRFDAVGFVILAIMSAMGGGIVRDVMLQAGAPVAITDPLYISTALVGAAIAFLWKLNSRFWVVALIVADGIVLGCWAATGAMKTMSVGFGVMPALLLGITTAVGGGMIRDVTAGNVPMVFGGNNLYATPALVSAGIMVLLYSLGQPTWGMILATVVGSSFTVLAHWRKWQLPVHSDWSLSLTSSQLRAMLAARTKAAQRGHRGLEALDDSVIEDVGGGSGKSPSPPSD
ncbi:trimeric intracellular cation channel family protein [Actinomyces minihominis]|uniref:trimeric intracellular cation channel family protein n=1 Tax=Actinomyces minihominis TaxID=2002838 RepID=UPI000C07D5EE|nr:trimeric intracellular cation channel family protein [Actinomyces minihominis]